MGCNLRRPPQEHQQSTVFAEPTRKRVHPPGLQNMDLQPSECNRDPAK